MQGPKVALLIRFKNELALVRTAILIFPSSLLFIDCLPLGFYPTISI